MNAAIIILKAKFNNCYPNSPCALRPIQQLKMEMPRSPKKRYRKLSSNKRTSMFHTYTDSMIQRFVQERSVLEFVVDTQPQCSAVEKIYMYIIMIII